MTIRLVADAVFTVDADDRILTPGALEITDGQISWVGDPGVPAAAETEVREVGGLLMPGLVNCHGHSPMTLVRSAGDGLPLDRWLSESVWPREALLSDDDVFWGMTLGANELLCNGTTTTCEQYRHPAPVVEALVASGIRAMYTPGIFDVPGAGTENTWPVLLQGACDLFDEMEGREGRLHLGFGPHAAYTVPPEGLTAIAEAAQSRNALFQIHLSETAAECRVVEERYGQSAPALLAKYGALEGRVIAAHAVWLDDADIEILLDHDVAVAHCPGSNGKLGSGVARLADLLARGVRVGLGTDGPASNDDLHLWDEMRLAALLARATAGDPTVVSSATALRRWGGPGAPGRRAGARPPSRRHPVAHRRRPVHAVGEPGRAARPPGLGRCGLSGDRRVGGRGGRGRGRALHTDRCRAGAGRGGPARPPPQRLLSFLAMSGFVDQAQLHARAGDGGAGAVSWRREAHVDKGGPDGGDGGHGGDVWLIASTNESSLLGFRDHPFRRATDGVHGSGQKRHGARGKDIEVPVPVGTVVRDNHGAVICDLSSHGSRALVAEGGQGGRGNARFLSNRRRAPAFAEQGEAGQEFWLDMELKLMADVALLGFPNVGKSTLIATVSAAKPKIADYPFTTLEPHLGVVRLGSVRDHTEFVVADIPGLVEGAADGKGLGLRFLRHIERARVLVVLLDLDPTAEPPPAEQLRILLGELGSYQPEMLERPRLVVGSKHDLSDGGTAEAWGCDLVLSAATNSGVRELVDQLALLVGRARMAASVAVETADVVVHRPVPEGVDVRKLSPGTWQVVGRAAERAVAFSDLGDDGALAEAVKRLRRLGVDRALTRAGVRDGDEVTVGAMTFTWGED
jgi:GTP-binding protein